MHEFKFRLRTAVALGHALMGVFMSIGLYCSPILCLLLWPVEVKYSWNCCIRSGEPGVKAAPSFHLFPIGIVEVVPSSSSSEEDDETEPSLPESSCSTTGTTSGRSLVWNGLLIWNRSSFRCAQKASWYRTVIVAFTSPRAQWEVSIGLPVTNWNKFLGCRQ